VGQLPSNPIFRQVPKSMTDVRGWINCVSDLRSWIQNAAVDRDPPGIVTGFTLTAKNSGVQAMWNSVPKAARYNLLRNVTNDPNTSTVIAGLPGHANVSFLDVADQLSEPTLYYWVQAFNAANDPGPISQMQFIANPSLSQGSAMPLPFNGPLGDGQHGPAGPGSAGIPTNTTATEVVPIYQLTTLDVANGDTWTAYASNPGGFVLSVKGRATIAGTIDLNYRGATGGVSVGAGGTNGKNGKPGFNFGGTGGGGGGSSATGGFGGHGAPIRGAYPLGGWCPGNITRSTTDTSWLGDAGAASTFEIRGQSQVVLGGGGTGGNNTGSSGTGGNAFAAVSLSAGMPDLFGLLWSFYRQTIFGWGSGGGGGAANAAFASGAGGNGGGCLVLLCDELDFTGTINANGQDGSAQGGFSSGGGGGGGGGCVLIGYRSLIANSGTINVAGGAGGSSNGGAGGAGYSNVFAMRM
jgi:hypothetical protein